MMDREQVKSRFGFDDRQMDKLEKILSDVPSDDVRDDVRDALNKMEKGIHFIEGALNKLERVDKGVYRRLCADDFERLKFSFYLERNKKLNRTDHKFLTWHPVDKCAYEISFKYMTRQRSSLELAALTQFWIGQGKTVPNRSREHPFYEFVTHALPDVKTTEASYERFKNMELKKGPGNSDAD